MTWPHVFAILLGGLAVIPLLYTLRVLSRRDVEGHGEPPVLRARPARVPALDDAGDAAPPLGRRSAPRFVFGRSDRRGERSTEERLASARPSATFEYTILPHRTALRQDAPDLGGFTKVPFLLYDRVGNCVMVHRRLSLN